MSEIQVSNVFFNAAKTEGIVGGVASNTFSIRAGGVDKMVVNTSVVVINTTSFSFSGNLTINTTAGIIANGSIGTSGQLLTSNGSSVYWSTPSTPFTTGKAIAMAIVFGG